MLVFPYPAATRVGHVRKQQLRTAERPWTLSLAGLANLERTWLWRLRAPTGSSWRWRHSRSGGGQASSEIGMAFPAKLC